MIQVRLSHPPLPSFFIYYILLPRLLYFPAFLHIHKYTHDIHPPPICLFILTRMENKQSGLVTPPIVSPWPIQPLSSSIATPTTNDSWKAVGSPPRPPLVSPPEEQQQKKLRNNESEQSPPQPQSQSPSQPSKDMNETNSTSKDKAKSQTKDPSEGCEHGDRVQEEHDASTITCPREIHASMLRDKGEYKNTHDQEVRNQSLQSSSITLGHASTTVTSTSSPSLPSVSSTYNISDERDKLERSHVSTPSKPPGLSLNTGSVTMAMTSRSGLESPLSMSSCIWTGRVSEDIDRRSPSAYSNTLTATNRGTPKIGLENDIGLSRQRDSAGQGYANRRSLSFSEPGGYSSGMGLNSPSGFSLQSENSMGSFRVPPSIQEEEPDELIEPRASRTRSHSTSATFGSGGLYSNFMRNSFDSHEQDPFAPRSPSNPMGLFPGQDQRHSLHNQLNSGPTWVGSWNHTMQDPVGGSNRRRSMTGESTTPLWEPHGSYSPMTASGDSGYGERQRPMRRYSVAPSSGFQTYDRFVENPDNYSGQYSMDGYDRYVCLCMLVIAEPK